MNITDFINAQNVLMEKLQEALSEFIAANEGVRIEHITCDVNWSEPSESLFHSTMSAVIDNARITRSTYPEG